MTKTTLTAALLLSTALTAQTVTQTRTGGTLGKSITHELSGTPNSLYLWLPSGTAGPTPLKGIDPNDDRSLTIGLDLVHLLAVGALTRTRTDLVIPLPADRSLHGFTLHAQALLFPGKGGRFFGPISNKIVTRLLSPGDVLERKNWLPAPRTLGITATVTKLRDGRCLAAGGMSGPFPKPAMLATTVMIDPNTQSASNGPSMSEPRAFHTAALVGHRILFAGGSKGFAKALASCDVYDTRTGKMSKTNPMLTPRAGATAAAFGDWQVIVCGGASDTTNRAAMEASITKSTELWDPDTGKWAKGPDMFVARALHRMIDLGNDEIMVLGGYAPSALANGGVQATATTEVFNPERGKWIQGSPMPTLTAEHEVLALGNARFLVAGGRRIKAGTTSQIAISDVAFYDHKADGGRWKSLKRMNFSRVGHTLMLLGDGRVLALGGVNGQGGCPSNRVREIETYDFKTDAWTIGKKLPVTSVAPSAVDLGNDQYVIVGGWPDVAQAAHATALQLAK